MTVPQQSEPWREPIVRAVLTAGITLLVFVIGQTLFGLAAGFGSLVGAVIGLASWQTLVYLVLVAAVTAVWRNAPARRRAGFFTLAGLAAASVQFAVQVVQINAGSGILLFIPAWIVSVTVFTACAAIGAYSAAGIPLSVREVGPRQLVIGGGVLALVLSGALVLALIGQWLTIYFRLFATGPIITTPEQGTAYLLTAGFAIGLAVAAIVIGRVHSVRLLFRWSIVLAGVALLAAFVFQVPSGRFWPDPAPPQNQLPDDYTPCFGGTDDPGCEGG